MGDLRASMATKVNLLGMRKERNVLGPEREASSGEGREQKCVKGQWKFPLVDSRGACCHVWPLVQLE